MLNIANYQGNANLKHNDLSPHIYWNDCNQKEHKQQMLVRIWRKSKKEARMIQPSSLE